MSPPVVKKKSDFDTILVFSDNVWVLLHVEQGTFTPGMC